MLVILMAGKIRAGKDTLISLLRKHFGQTPVEVIGFSDAITQVLNIFGIKPDRPAYSKLCTLLKNEYGPDIFRRAVRRKIEKLREFRGVVIVHGVRFLKDISVSEGFGCKLVGVAAKEETRYSRAKKTGKDGNLTLEQFRQNEKAETEGQIKELLKLADYSIENNGTLDELEAVSAQLAKTLLDYLNPAGN